MDNETKLQLKEWVIDNMFKCEFGMLDEKKHKLFVDCIESRIGDPFLQECFTLFEQVKKSQGLPVTKIEE